MSGSVFAMIAVFRPKLFYPLFVPFVSTDNEKTEKNG